MFFHGKARISPIARMEPYHYYEDVFRHTLDYYRTGNIRYVAINKSWWHSILTEPHNHELRDFVESRFHIREKLSYSNCYYGNILIFEADSPRL